jgi:hypothetical protein
MAAGQNEPVAISPAGLSGVASQVLVQQHVQQGRQRHRRSGVSGACLLHHVDNQSAHNCHREFVEVAP